MSVQVLLDLSLVRKDLFFFDLNALHLREPLEVGLHPLSVLLGLQPALMPLPFQVCRDRQLVERGGIDCYDVGLLEASKLLLHLVLDLVVEGEESLCFSPIEAGCALRVPVKRFGLLLPLFALLLRQIVPKHRVTLLRVPW